MIVLQVEHPVPDYKNWKKVFDSDPANRKQSGVKRYRIFRQADNPNIVIVELEFDTLDEAKKMHAALQQLWNQIDGKVISDPKARIIELAETKEY